MKTTIVVLLLALCFSSCYKLLPLNGHKPQLNELSLMFQKGEYKLVLFWDNAGTKMDSVPEHYRNDEFLFEQDSVRVEIEYCKYLYQPFKAYSGTNGRLTLEFLSFAYYPKTFEVMEIRDKTFTLYADGNFYMYRLIDWPQK